MNASLKSEIATLKARVAAKEAELAREIKRSRRKGGLLKAALRLLINLTEDEREPSTSAATRKAMKRFRPGAKVSPPSEAEAAGAKRDEQGPLHLGGDVTLTYSDLITLKDMGITVFRPQGATQYHDVSKLLQEPAGKGKRVCQRERKRHVARRIDRDYSARNEVFISYSHKDKKWLAELKTTLAPLIGDDKLRVWDDTRITPGDKRREEIREALSRAKVGVLLVSRQFLASDSITENQLPPLLEAAESKGLILFWIPVEHCLYNHTVIDKYKAAWDPHRPLATLGNNLAKALVEIGEKLRNAYEGL